LKASTIDRSMRWYVALGTTDEARPGGCVLHLALQHAALVSLGWPRAGAWNI
jgi:hypothetical protein